MSIPRSVCRHSLLRYLAAMLVCMSVHMSITTPTVAWIHRVLPASANTSMFRLSRRTHHVAGLGHPYSVDRTGGVDTARGEFLLIVDSPFRPSQYWPRTSYRPSSSVQCWPAPFGAAAFGENVFADSAVLPPKMPELFCDQSGTTCLSGPRLTLTPVSHVAPFPVSTQVIIPLIVTHPRSTSF